MEDPLTSLTIKELRAIAPDVSGDTALEIASSRGHADIVRLLS